MTISRQLKKNGPQDSTGWTLRGFFLDRGDKWSDEAGSNLGFQTLSMTEGSLHEPRPGWNSSTSFHRRLYQHCKTAQHLETIYLPRDLFSDSTVWERARAAGFSEDGKSGSSKCSTKAGRCPLNGLLQMALTCSSVRRMKCLWRDRAAQIKVSVWAPL